MGTTRKRRQFQDLFSDVLTYTGTLNVANLADGAGATSSVTIPGAALGDFVLVSLGVDLQDMVVTGYVQAANTVEVRVQNESTGAVDLASTTLRIAVLKPASHAFV